MIDPKPNLSQAAIEANINYAQAQQKIAAEKYRQALAEETRLMRLLALLK